jgi:hypothetical protein
MKFRRIGPEDLFGLLLTIGIVGIIVWDVFGGVYAAQPDWVKQWTFVVGVAVTGLATILLLVSFVFGSDEIEEDDDEEEQEESTVELRTDRDADDKEVERVLDGNEKSGRR